MSATLLTTNTSINTIVSIKRQLAVPNMATNSKGHRDGSVRNRSQFQHPKTGNWVKRNTTTGRFMDQKTSSSTPFKGVAKEKDGRR